MMGRIGFLLALSQCRGVAWKMRPAMSGDAFRANIMEIVSLCGFLSRVSAMGHTSRSNGVHHRTFIAKYTANPSLHVPGIRFGGH
jgi:hypothetical protein